MSDMRTKPMRATETRQATPRVTVYSGPGEAMWSASDLVGMKNAEAKRQVVSIQPGGGSAAKDAQLASHRFTPSHSSLRKYVTVGTSRKLDLVSNEGIEHLRAICAKNKGAVIMFFYAPRKEESTRVPLALKEMQVIAKECGVHIKIFVGDGDHLRADLEEFSDTLIEVQKCEPNPDAVAAFALLRVENRPSFSWGKRSMWQFKKDASGKLLRSSTVFVHEKVAMRFKQELRCHGWSMQKIADLFGVNVSTIWRDLQTMPTGEKCTEPMSESRLTMFIEHLNLKDPRLAKVEDDDLVDDEEDELDDEPTPSREPMRKASAKTSRSAKSGRGKR